jgi:hypothetical protein
MGMFDLWNVLAITIEPKWLPAEVEWITFVVSNVARSSKPKI